MARILIADKNGNIKENCASPSSFDYSKLPAHLQQALHCVDNSYTIGNDAGLHQFVWGYQGACAAQGSDLRGNATAYFQLEADLFAKYNPDRTLKAAGYDLTKLSTIDAKAYLTTVLKGWGGGATSGFYTCDKAYVLFMFLYFDTMTRVLFLFLSSFQTTDTDPNYRTGTRLSALNVCFTTTAPYTIAKCPSGLLGKNGDCSSKLVVYKKNSIPVPPECKAYYP